MKLPGQKDKRKADAIYLRLSFLTFRIWGSDQGISTINCSKGVITYAICRGLVIRSISDLSEMSGKDEDHRVHRGWGGDREDPQASWPLGLKGYTPFQKEDAIGNNYLDGSESQILSADSFYVIPGLPDRLLQDFETAQSDCAGYGFCYLCCVFQPRKSYDLNIIPSFFPTQQPAPILARYWAISKIGKLLPQRVCYFLF
jgi:hypothetical protein